MIQRSLLQDDRGKGPEKFPEFDLGVDDVFHLFTARIGQDAPVAQGTRLPLLSISQNT
jgi:hypothetical protein